MGGKLQLESDQQTHRFDALFAAVHVIAEEEKGVVLVWPLALFEQAQQVLELAVDVATYFEGGGHLQQDGLLQEEGTALVHHSNDDIFLQPRVRAGCEGTQILDDDLVVVVVW